MRTSTYLKSLIAAAALTFSSLGFAGFDTETDQNDVILAGHDAVAYFTENAAVVGSADYTVAHKGAIYRFSSAKNRDMFKSNPSKYEPAYGGFCAYGATFGKKFEIDGKAFEVVDGKLYVNKNIDVYKAWKEAVPKHIQEADAAWKTIEFGNPEEL